MFERRLQDKLSLAVGAVVEGVKELLERASSNSFTPS